MICIQVEEDINPTEHINRQVSGRTESIGSAYIGYKYIRQMAPHSVYLTLKVIVVSVVCSPALSQIRLICE